MTGIIHFEAFLLAGILLNLTPGNDTIFILAKSIGQGRQAGIVAAFGIAAGSVVHTFLAAFGLSIIISNSPLLFNIVKYAGAVYLLFMGWKMLTETDELNPAAPPETTAVDYFKVFRDGLLTNLLNPKVALFFIAFLPQFIDSEASSAVLPFLLLGCTFITTGLIWCLVLATFAAQVFGKLKSSPKTSKLVNQACGLALIGLGLKVALTGKR